MRRTANMTEQPLIHPANHGPPNSDGTPPFPLAFSGRGPGPRVNTS